MDISNLEMKSLRQLVKSGAVDINTRFLWKNIGDVSILQLAIEHGDDEFIDDLLLNKVDVNLNTESYGTTLHQAVGRGDLELVEKIVNHGADINIKSCSGDKFTALHAAVKLNHYQIAEFLIKSGADLAAGIDDDSLLNTFYKWTPLDLATVLNKIEFVELLLKNLNFHRNLDFCHSPVYLAIRLNKIPIVKLFLDRGAKVKFLNRGSFGSCLSLTFESDNLEIFKLFLYNNGNLVTATDEDDNSLVHLAVRESSRDILSFLLENGADINVVNRDNQTALDLALVKFSENQHTDNSRNLETVETILEHIVELCAANMYLIKRNLQAISGEEFDSYYDDCVSDVNIMKKTKIGESNLSYHSVLVMSVHKLAIGLTHVRSIDEKELKSFTLYEKLIFFKLKEGEERKKLLVKSQDFLYDLFHYDLPDVFLRNIFNHLSNDDLRLLSQ